MSVTSFSEEPDMQYWEQYLLECKVMNVRPKLKDYLLFLEEADIDRKENYEKGMGDEY